MRRVPGETPEFRQASRLSRIRGDARSCPRALPAARPPWTAACDDPPVSVNLDVVRSMYACHERGDFAAGAEFIDPDIDVVGPDGPEPGAGRGLAELANWWRDFLTSWEDFRLIAEEYRELDEDHILVLFRRTGRGRRSGMEIGELSGSKGAEIVEVRDGKVVKIVSYWERDRALADLGLTPEA